MEVNFSLFLLNKLSFTILLEATPKRPEIISEEVLTTEGDIVIKKSDISLYQGYLNSLLKSENISEEDKFKIKTIVVKENAKITVKDLFDNPFNSENIKASKELVAKIVDCVLKDRDVIYDMVSLKTYDYYTYIHSVNVAVMSAGLGAAIGLKREDIEKLGIGALLHDIGKSAIPHEILNKQGSLDNTEFQIFKTHVIEGEKILRTHNNIPEESFDAVLQHHEKLSGKGYPSGLSEEAIKLFGRITAIADCYDALTTPRIKKYPLTPFFALSVIAKETINYDHELLKEFVKMLGRVK
ncbi:HD-GYP domain-containing protein [Dissulfurispira sp.]|uniref:HD-GYP domain-containing protein n=1 Tax=Dissulfurispira sp. TaxID=2817609 RepID=UPI002FDADE2F